jgi:predicted HTH transcriptional regulator
MSTNYSYQTSLPAYHENTSGKIAQAQKINAIVNEKKSTCLKEIEDILNIPQSTVSARISDLRNEGKVKYDGVIVFKGRKRKSIVPVN